ncbi:hypothetical protein [Cohnella sp. AR92]|uniref:hypothetical protein n=1 Tax=Cohnella sp. AR92 TaxID=648716 RepID=UPI000F8E3B3A|nr:hypothetical protein [Cohnella sp. AR92]RUS44988.1 hypothetical protein ELR57_22295 [Cohnella sp. AR92]
MPSYVFLLYDKGMVQHVTVYSEADGIAKKASQLIRAYLSKNGYQDKLDKVPRTNDGFAHIFRSVPGDELSAVTWTFFLDGDVSYEEMEADLEQVVWHECRQLCEQFVAANENHFVCPPSVEENAAHNPLLKHMWRELASIAVVDMLFSGEHHFYSIVDEEGLMVLPGLRMANLIGYVILKQPYGIGNGFRLEPRSAAVSIG